MKKLITMCVFLTVFAMHAWAAVGDVFTVGNYNYEVTTQATSSAKGVLLCTGLSSAGANVSSVNIPYLVANAGFSYHVSGIKANAFLNNTRITNVRLNYGINVISTNAFKGCTSLQMVRLPSSITRIGQSCFAGCNNITTVYYAGLDGSSFSSYSDSFEPSSSRKLFVPFGADNASLRSRYAFAASKFPFIQHSSEAWDYSMTNGALFVVSKVSTTSAPHECTIIGFNANATEVSNGIFRPSATISPGSFDRSFKIVAVSDSAFMGNSGLKNLDMSRATGVESYGRYFASSCSNLTSVTLASGFVEAFGLAHNPLLANVNFLEGVQGFNTFALSQCTAITSLNIPASVRSIAQSFVDGCKSLQSFSVASGNTSFSSDSPEGSLYNADKSILYRVPEGHIFAYKTFPSNLKRIYDYAFRNVKAIKTIELPYGLERIDDYAFYYCQNLANVFIPSSVKTMGDGVFNNTGLIDLYINTPVPPASSAVTVVHSNPGSINLHVPRKCENAYRNANWNGFLSYNKDGVLSRDYRLDYIDYSITSTKSEVINDTQYNGRCKVVRSASSRDVANAKNIPAAININGKNYAVTCIDNYSFYTTHSFSISGCELVDSVGDGAFTGLALTSITLPYVSYIGDFAFDECRLLTSARWGNRVKRVRQYAFSNAPLAHDIYLPVGTNHVGSMAFCGAKSKRILLPSTVYEFSNSVFKGMTSLETIILNCTIFNASTNFELDGVPIDCKVLVPVGYKASARAHANWSRFGNNIEEGAFDFCLSPNSPLSSSYTVTVTSNSPITVDGVTYAGKAQYVYNKNIKDATSFILDNSEVDRMTLGSRSYLMTAIGDSCFAHSNISSFSFTRMSNLERIGKKAFYGSKLTSADFGSLAIQFRDDAFTNASQLTEIVTRKNSTWSGKFYGNNANNFNFFVPYDLVNRYVNIEDLKNFEYDNDESCAQRVAPCFTASASTFDLGAIVPLDFTNANYSAYAINAPGNPATRIIPTEPYSNCYAGRGVILADLTPGSFYKVKRLLGNFTTSTPYLKPVYETTNLNSFANSYYWDVTARKFIRVTGSKTVESGRTYLTMPGNAPEYYLDVFAPATSNGDVNGDGNIDIADANIIINITLGKVAAGSYPAADVNANGSIDVSDLNALLNIILGK